jgi:large subunit ribosomal protein L30
MPKKATGTSKTVKKAKTTKKAKATKTTKKTAASKATKAKKAVPAPAAPKPAEAIEKKKVTAPAAATRVRIRQVRSRIGHARTYRRTLEALGLRRHQQEVVLPNTPSVRGMVFKVRHLVRVTPEEA